VTRRGSFYLAIIQIFFPRYYKRVWNTEFIDQMKKVRDELHDEFPDNTEVVDRHINKAYGRWLK